MEESPNEEQLQNSKVPKQLQAHVYKKGMSGNPNGRPIGSVSMKVYVRNKLLSMTDDEREEYLEGIDKRVIWEMAESKPSQGIGQADDLEKLQFNIIKYDESNNNTLPVQPEDLSTRITQSSPEVQDISSS